VERGQDQFRQEPLAVVVVPEDILALIPTVHDVTRAYMDEFP
jgi:hypothetical protein